MDGRTVLITGASSGIGKALARVAAADGHRVLLVARRRARLDELVDALTSAGGRAETFVADLLDQKDVARLADRLASVDDPVDHLVNNAGITDYSCFARSDLASARAQMHLHADVPMALTHAVLPGQLARGRGGVLNIASTAGLQAAPGLAAYAASKAALITFSESLHDEVRPHGVTITCSCPGYTRTELQDAAGVDASALPSLAWMDAAEVARLSWRAHLKGRALVVPGVLNTVSAKALRLAPRKVARRVSGSLIGRVRPTSATTAGRSSSS